MTVLFRKHLAGPALALGLALTLPDLSGAEPSLDRGFRTPPRAARPWTYWFWMDGNLSREGITADLEAMQRACLGGVIIMEVDVGIPRGPVKFISPEWRALFKHVVAEAERLGLQITLNAGPGWTGSGGPWVKPEQSMPHLVASETNVSGPRRFDAVLPRATPRKPFFGEGALPPDLEQARKEFYRDVAVLAFPPPVGDERIAEIDEKALYVRAPYSSQPGVKPLLPALAYVCGLGFYDLYLNGRKVGDQVLDPGWTNYRKRCLDATHEVTALLRNDSNAIGVLLGNGLYNVRGGRCVKFTGSFGPPKLIFQLHLEFEDGTSTNIASDGSWKTAPGPITFSCSYGGEDYDARFEQSAVAYEVGSGRYTFSAPLPYERPPRGE
jgi:hypothetical protein